MVGREKLWSFMEAGMAAAGSRQIEITALSKLLRVVRFANSAIHQPMEERDLSFFIRVLKNGRLGYASINGLDEDGFRHALETAQDNTVYTKALSDLSEFPKPAAVPPSNGCVKATAAALTADLENRVQKLLAKGEGTGASFAGVFWTNTAEMSVMNSGGIKCYHKWTSASCQTVATHGSFSGFSAQASPDVDAIRPGEVGEAALNRALRFDESIELPPGEYECLLEEYAAADLILYLSYMAFTGETVEEGRSILGVRKGKKIADASVSVWDDGTNPLSFRMPFDSEGTPRQKVIFINNGIAQDVVHDLQTAARAGARSTGHALPADFSEGPLPLNLEMAAGSASKDDMLRQMKRGLLITRFHYIREVHPLKTLITGMTRDGVFLVENGKIAARVKNFRFTESILRALSGVKAASRQCKLVAGEVNGGLPTAVLVPKLLVEKFTFTGTTYF